MHDRSRGHVAAGAGGSALTATTAVETPEPSRIDSSTNSRFDLAEVWQYRHLVLLLALRDLRIRYKQTAIGVGWALLQPLTTMVFFSLFFGRLGRLPSDGLPYPLFYFTALLPWTYVTHAVTNATNSLHEQSRIISRVYFPKIVLPLAPLFSGLVDVAVSMVLLVAMMLWFGRVPTWSAPLALVFLGLGVLTAAGASLWLSALNSRFRDVRYALTFGLQLWMYASPVVYPMSLVPEAWRAVYALNPMAVVVQGFRWSLSGAGYPGTVPTVIALMVAAILCVSGFVMFRGAEADMADLL